jgi:hypothetical protein
MLDKKAINFKVRYLYGKHGRKCGGYKREGECTLPGEVYLPAMCYWHREVVGKVGRSQQRA